MPDLAMARCGPKAVRLMLRWFDKLTMSLSNGQHDVMVSLSNHHVEAQENIVLPCFLLLCSAHTKPLEIAAWCATQKMFEE